MAHPVRSVWWLAGCCAGIVVCAAVPCRATQEAAWEDPEQDSLQHTSDEKIELVLNEAQIERMQRRLDQLTEQQHKLREAMEQIKAVLVVIKVRVTN